MLEKAKNKRGKMGTLNQKKEHNNLLTIVLKNRKVVEEIHIIQVTPIFVVKLSSPSPENKK